jgi:hypothetical protein
LNNIFDIWNFVNFITDKYRNGYLSPEEFSSALANGQLLYWNYNIGLRQKGNELSSVALSPFNRVVNVTSNPAGLAAKPLNYAETQGIFIGSNSVNQIVHNELEYALNSVLYPIAENPRFIQESNGVVIYPKQVHNIEWHYIASPITPVLGYTTTTNGIVYNPLTSVQLEFDRQYWQEIVLLSLPYIGVNLSNNEVVGLQEMFNLNANNGNN